MSTSGRADTEKLVGIVQISYPVQQLLVRVFDGLAMELIFY